MRWARIRSRSARRNFYGTDDRQRHAVPPDGRGQHHPPGRRGAGAEFRLPEAARRRSWRSTASTRCCKKGIALTPVKFGISFTATWHNQAGALVHVYRDGSIHLSHGGTEMGQGLHIKVAQVVAEAFGVPLDRREDHREQYRQGAEHVGDGGVVGHRPQRHGGARWLRTRSRRGWHAHAARIYEVEPKDVHWEFGGIRAGQAVRAVRRAGDLVLDEPGAAFGAPGSTRRRRSTGTGRPGAGIRSTISPMARRAPR